MVQACFSRRSEPERFSASVLCEKQTTAAERRRTKLQSTGLMCSQTARGARLPLACLLNSQEHSYGERSQTTHLCCYLFLFQLSVETCTSLQAPRPRQRNTEGAANDLCGQECTGEFVVSYAKKCCFWHHWKLMPAVDMTRTQVSCSLKILKDSRLSSARFRIRCKSHISFLIYFVATISLLLTHNMEGLKPYFVIISSPHQVFSL